MFAVDGELSITNSTLSNNIATSGVVAGRDVYITSNLTAVTAAINNSILGQTDGGDSDFFASGASTSGGGDNLIRNPGTGAGAFAGSFSRADPLLDPAGLKNNGGPTDTIALLPGSPAIDAGNKIEENLPTTDQRGDPRPAVAGTNPDIGAYEFQANQTPPSPPPPPPAQTQLSLPPSVSVAFGPVGEVVEVVNSAGGLTQFDAFGVHQLSSGGVRDASVAVGPGGEVLLVTYTNGALYQFDASGARLLSGDGIQSASVAFGPDGEVLEIVNTAGLLTQYDAAGAHLISGGVQSASVAFGPAGEVLEINSTAGVLTQYDATGAHPVSGGVQSAGVAFTPNGLVLDIIFSDGSLDQFDALGVHALGVIP